MSIQPGRILIGVPSPRRRNAAAPRRGHSNVLASVLGEHTRNHLLVGFEINQESFAKLLVVVMVSLIGTILYAQQFSYPFP